MIKIILKKFLQCLIAVFLLSIVVFYMARLSPGDPLEAYYGNAIERMNKGAGRKCYGEVQDLIPLFMFSMVSG